MGFIKGHEVHSIDAKGRFALPAKMRKDVSESAEDTFIVTRGVDNYVAVYPLNEWRVIEEQLESLNPFDPKSRIVLNYINMWCEEVKPDAQSRIGIPKSLLELTSIEGKVKIIGMGNHMAVWNPEEHDKYLKAGSETYESAFAEVFGALYAAKQSNAK